MSVTKKVQSLANPVKINIFLLTMITMGAHFYLAAQPDEKLHFFFLLNGIGYLGLLIAFFYSLQLSFHNVIRWVLFWYIIVTVILWFVLGSPSEGKIDPFDVTIKAVEITLAIQFFFLSKMRIIR